MAFVPVFAASELAPGAMRRVKIGDTEIAIYHIGDDFHATGAICTHERADLTKGRLEGGAVFCPLHGAKFEVATGRVLSPPAFKKLRTYPVRVADGVLEVDAG